MQKLVFKVSWFDTLQFIGDFLQREYEQDVPAHANPSASHVEIVDA